MQMSLALAKRRARMIAISVAAVGIVVGNIASVAAAALGGVSVELDDPRTSQTGVEYTINATSGHSATAAQCVLVQFDTAVTGAGGVPSGMDTTSATFDSSTAVTYGNWSGGVDVSTNGVLEITYGTGEAVSAGNFVWSGIQNGDTEGTTYYALVNTYANTDCSTGPIDDAVVAFVFRDGELVSLTIPPTLTFTTTGVASGQDVWPDGDPGSLSTTVASTGTDIDHGTTVNATTNGVSAHDLNIATNASGGYNVYVRHTGPLTNATSATIDDWTGTNATPTSFPAAGTEAWGYTTDDSDIAQFYGLDLWAGFPTAGGSGGDLVATGASATASTETVRVGHQVGVASTTDAGTYTTTIVYTVVATF